MKSIFFPSFFLLLLGLTACRGDVEREVEKVQVEMLKREHQLNQQALRAYRQPLLHQVMLDLKPELDVATRQQLKKQLLRLAEIPGVQAFEVGEFHDLGDPRALAGYELMFQMRFENDSTYQAYQTDSTHLSVKASLKDLLGAPPATYDMILAE
jgi:hypothetical protein